MSGEQADYDYQGCTENQCHILGDAAAYVCVENRSGN